VPVAISLIGLPGSGKSTLARHLARRLDTQWIDTDFVIEREAGCSIRTIFEREGEARFRDIEASTLARLLNAAEGVIATGGGIVLREENRAALAAQTACVYLRSTPEELFRRLRHDRKRPLLQTADPLDRLRDLHATRDPLYRETSHFVIDTGRPSMPMLVNLVLMQLELAGVCRPSREP
jgi:shikimate kinase